MERTLSYGPPRTTWFSRCDVHGCLPDIILRDFFAGEKTLLKVHGTLCKLFNSLSSTFFFFWYGLLARLLSSFSKAEQASREHRFSVARTNQMPEFHVRISPRRWKLCPFFAFLSFFPRSTFVGKLLRWETVVHVGSNVCRLIREAIKREWKEWYIHATVSLSEKRRCLRWFTWPSGRQLEPLNEMSVHHGN